LALQNGNVAVPLRNFKNVWQAKDFKSNVFVAVAKKGVNRRVFGCVASKGLVGVGLS
jgi:hypothetical protein